MTEPKHHRVISVREAARALRVSLWTMYRWTGRGGRIPAYKLGRRKVISTADLERFLQECRQEPGFRKGAGGQGGRK